MNYKVLVTKNDSPDVVLEKDFNCGYLFLGESDGCTVSRILEGCDFEISLHSAFTLMKFAYENDDILENFARLLYESRKMEEKNDN